MTKVHHTHKESDEATPRTQLPRMYDWIIFSALLFALFWWIRVPSHIDYLKSIGVPADIPVIVGKATAIALAGIGAMWFDRSMFYYARPDLIVRNPDDAEPWGIGDAIAFSGACLRRSVITAVFMICAAAV